VTARGARLVAQILAFSRRQNLDPQPVDLNKIILRMTETLTHILGGGTRIETSCAGGLWLASADSTQVELAIMNLVINARDAMPSGGTVTISTENVDAARLDGRQGLRPGDYVRVTVADSGLGMSEEVLAHVFEPYFTTKETGKGTGLGLSMVQGMAAQLGGSIAIDTRVGHGTSVHVLLPRAATDAVKIQSAKSVPALKGSGRILVVEDDPDVISVLIDALGELGYEPMAVSDVESALSLVERGEPLDAVLSDFKMPGMSGVELLTRLREMRPGLKGMLITGNMETTEQLQTPLPLLRKPFHIAALAEHLEALFQPDAHKGRASEGSAS
jgi:CheY-like chemotaxis protein/two-component sensor histidine kinase